jgi:DNA recombination protein RmuC
MPEWVYLIAGVAVGALAGWFIARARAEKQAAEALSEARSRAASAEAREGELRRQVEQAETEGRNIRASLEGERLAKASAEAELKATMENLREQRTMLDAMKTEMKDTFDALSSTALKSSNEQFLQLAQERLGNLLQGTQGRLGEHKAALDGLIKPLADSLKRYEQVIGTIEEKRGKEYASLDEQIKLLATTHRELQKETGNLVTALRKPHVRGRWGEITLRNVVELAGMSSHCDFTEQVSMNTEQGRLRPDMIIRMPGDHLLVVDSKVSMEALLDAMSAQSEDERRTQMQRHARHVKEQVSRLSSKAYWQQLGRSTELAILFMGEQALSVALELEPTLIEESLEKKVLVATPTSLFALLSAVAYGWRQEQLAENAEKIAVLGRELYERVRVWSRHLGEVGASLEKSVLSYNKAMGSLESRVIPSLRKFKEYGASTSEDVPQAQQVEQNPRNLSLIE